MNEAGETVSILAKARRSIYTAPVGQMIVLETLLQKLRGEPKAEVGLELAQTLELLSIGRRLLGDYQAGLRYSVESRELFTELGDEGGVAKAAILAGNLHLCMGDCELALAAFKEGLALRRKLGDRKGEAGALGSIGAVHDEMKQWREARRCYLESLDISRGLGDRMFEARTLNNLGETNLNMGRNKVASDLCHAALVVFQELGERVEQVNVHNNLGRIAHADGRFEAAKMAFERALAEGQALTLPVNQAASRFFLACLMADEQSPFYSRPAAISALQSVLKEAVALGVRTLEADINQKLTDVCTRAN